MSEHICDEDVRDGHPCVEVRRPTQEALRLAKTVDYPAILVRVTHNTKKNGGGWWNLDDLLRAMIVERVRFGDWYIVPGELAPRLIAAFDAVGKLDRLEFMALGGSA